MEFARLLPNGVAELHTSLVSHKPIEDTRKLSELVCELQLNDASRTVQTNRSARALPLESGMCFRWSAAAVVLGRSAEDWVEWKDELGRTLSDVYRAPAESNQPETNI